MGQVVLTKESADILGVDEFSSLCVHKTTDFGVDEFQIKVIDNHVSNPNLTKNEDGSWTFEVNDSTFDTLRSSCPHAKFEDAVVMPMLRTPGQHDYHALVNPHVQPSKL